MGLHVAGLAPSDRASSGMRLKEPEFVALFQQEVVTNLAVWGVAERIAFNVTTAASG
jgi:hypothetical protein